MKKLYKSLIYFGLAIAGLFGPLVSFADGSKDLYPSTTAGGRAFLYSNNYTGTSGSTLASWPFKTIGTHYAYIGAGEVIHAASSAQNSGNGKIVLTAPDGTVYDSGTNNSAGLISNRTAELAGPRLSSQGAGGNRYTTFNRTAAANQEGIWRIDFYPPGNVNSSNTPVVSNIAATGDWSQGTSGNEALLIAAWDVSVESAGLWMPGRVYTNVLNLHINANQTAGYHGVSFVLTKDGYTYKVSNNGNNGIGFTFFVNNNGFVDAATQEPTYKSLNTSSSLSSRVHNPNNADTERHITHKMFYALPADDLPTEATGAVPEGRTWLKNTVIIPGASAVRLVGVDGTEAQVSNKGGYIEFQAGAQGQYTIVIESTETPAAFVTRTLTGMSVPELNRVFWDGKDGGDDGYGTDGDPLPSGMVRARITVQLQGAEVHFPFIDMEYNQWGTKVELLDHEELRATGDEIIESDIVYWNDKDLPNVSNGSNPNPKNNSHLTLTYDGSTTEGDGNGRSSGGHDGTTANGHIWGVGGSGSSGQFGDNKSIDTWTFIKGEAVTINTDITVKIADLRIIEIAPSETSVLVGDELTYTVKVFNDGPSDVEGAPFTFTVPPGFDPTGFTPTFVGAGCGTETTAVSFDEATNTFSSVLNLPDGCEVTYTFTGTVTSEMAAGDMDVEATIMRPNDVTDPDATNQDPATPPTDPHFECDDNGQGGVCNNIMPNATVTFVGPLTAAKTIVGNPSAVKPGDVITYEITITNPNPGTAVAGVSVTDEIPEHLTTITNITPVGTPADGVISWTGLTIPAGDELTLSFQATVRDDVPASTTTLENTAEVTDSNYPDDPVEASVIVNVDIPAFTLVKAVASVTDAGGVARADGAFAAIGDRINYTITVTNTGNVTLYNIAVADVLTGDTWTILELSPTDDPEVFTPSYVIEQGDLDAGSVLNAATAEGEDPNDDPVIPEGPDDGEVETPAIWNPSLKLIKAAVFTGPLVLNDEITYTFKVSNEGNVTIGNIVVDDPLTGGVIANTSTATGSSWPSAVGTLAPGESVILTSNYQVSEADISNGLIENTATVSGNDPSNPGELLPPHPSNTVIVSVVNNCDPSSGNVDTDGDGIADICDLDDDNDGILDTDECPFVPSPIIVANTDEGELITYNTATNNLSVLCSGITVDGGIMGDIAMDRDGNVWGITSTNKLVSIDPDNCAVTEVADLGFSGTGLSFLPDGNLLAGGGDDALVRKIDVVGGTYETSTWADFGTGFSNGDFIVIGNKAYVLWFDNAIDPENPILLEVAIDAEFNYVSHTVLGALPRFTWGLAKANGDQLFGVTGIGADGASGPIGTIVRINMQPSFSWTLVFSYPQLFYGATSVDEMALECDTDGDGIPNRLDLDSDNDGCPDAIEFYGTTDAVGTDGNHYYGDGNPPAVNADGTVVGASYSGDYTNVITATLISISEQPTDLDVYVGNDATFTVSTIATNTTSFDSGMPDYSGSTAVDSSPGLLYQWQESTDDGETWTDITDGSDYDGTATAGLSVRNADLSRNGNRYRVIVSHQMHPCGVPSAEVVLSILNPTLEFVKEVVLTDDVNGNDEADLGDELTYIFTVTNTGNVILTDVVITDTDLDGLSPLTHSWPGAAGTLLPDESYTATATYVITETDIRNGSVSNIAVVDADGPADPADPDGEPVPLDPTESTNDPDNPGTPGEPGIPTDIDVADPDPSLSFAKTGVLSADGNTIEYTFTVTNTGNVTMDDITITDPKIVADNITYGTWPAPATPGILAPGESVGATATYTVTQAEKDAGEVENNATVTGTPPFDPTDPDQPGEPIDPVPSTPDIDNPGTPGDPGEPTVVDVPANPALSFVKEADVSGLGNPVAAGDEIIYTFTVTNTGNVTMTDITLAEADFSGTGTVPAFGFVGNSGTSPAGTLAPGEVGTYRFMYALTQADIDAGGVENLATVTGTPPTTDPDDPADPITVPSSPDPSDPDTPPGTETGVPIPTDPSLSFVKTGTLSGDGNTIKYTFTVTNTGNVTITDVSITDPKIDADDIAYSAWPIPDTPGLLAPGQSVNATASYTVAQKEKDAGMVENLAEVTGTPPTTDPDDPAEPITVPSSPDPSDPDTPPGTETGVPVPADPSISFTKEADLSGVGSPIAAGDEIIYTFTVTNTGNVTMTDITLAEADFSGTGTVPAFGFVGNSGTSPEGTLAPSEVGTYRFTYALTQADIDAGGVENLATVTGTPPTTDPSNPAQPITPVPSTPDVDNPGAPGDPGKPTVVDVPADPALSFAKTGALSADGNTIEYTFLVTNTGNVTMTDIKVTDPKITDPIVLDETTLAPGESATGTATYTVTQPEKDAGEVKNNATVTGTPPFDSNDPGEPGQPIDPVPSTPDIDNPGTPGNPGIPTIVEVPADPALSFAKTGALSADGNTIEYTFLVTNTGNVTMTDIKVTDPKITDPIVLDRTTLAPGESAAGTATYTVTQPEKDAGGVENNATVTGTPPFDPANPGQPGEPIDPVPSTPNVDNPGTPGNPGVPTETIIEQRPLITITKSARNGNYTQVGDVITYDITVHNTGNVTLTDVMITDDNADAGSISPTTIASLAPDEMVSVTATHTITQADVDAGYIYNSAKATGNAPGGDPIEGDSYDPDPNNPVDPACPDCTITPIQVRAAVALVKEASNNGTGRNGLFIVGDEIVYTFTVHNTGNVSLSNFRLTDAKLGLHDALIAGTLSPGNSLTYQAGYIVTQADIDAMEIVNTATIKANTPDGDTISDVSGTGAGNDTPTVVLVAESPESVDDAISTPQYTPITINILDNDKEGSSPLDPSTVLLVNPETGAYTKDVTIPGEGTYAVEADGRITFTPEREFFGESSVRYVVSDENGLLSGPATITVTVVRSQPEAVDDHAETTFNTPVRIPILDNDEADGASFDPATIEIIDQPRFGTVAINSDGTVTYTPNQYYTGTDSFTYRVRDANGNWTNMASVSITVSGFHIPNIITPNGDGQNDRFVIIGLENYDNAEVTIFNRWGNQIYRSTDYKQDWAGQGLNEGTYYYLITLRKDGRETVHKGWVLVKRN